MVTGLDHTSLPHTVTEKQIKARAKTLVDAWLRGATEGGRYATRDQIEAVMLITERRVREDVER